MMTLLLRPEFSPQYASMLTLGYGNDSGTGSRGTGV